MARRLAFRYVVEFVDDVVLASDKEILSALRLLLTRAKGVAEPSGAAAANASMFGRTPIGLPTPGNLEAR